MMLSPMRTDARQKYSKALQERRIRHREPLNARKSLEHVIIASRESEGVLGICLVHIAGMW